ncbi:MAG: leucyl aminopeptidase family protein [Hyphomicrobium sp.]
MTDTAPLMARDVFETGAGGDADTPLWLLKSGELPDPARADATQRAWLAAQKFSGAAKKLVSMPGSDGSLRGVALGLGDGASGDPSGPSDILTGLLSQSLPSGTYSFATPPAAPDLAAIAWGLGAYKFQRYRSNATQAPPRPKLRIPAGANAATVINTTEAIWFGRDLINTPASDMGPQDLEDAARDLAARHGANVKVVTGDDLLRQNFPMIHAVGRASPRPPRLIDITWGREDAPKITLVGKGITFDTGGLDIKPASGMLLMKKDMGGAATAFALAHMIMGQKLRCRLRVLLAVAENAISGDAFRPGDILKSRAGLNIEIGNTDAEGRLVLADALTLADEESPDSIFVFATLTGAARTALGPDLPAFFTNDDAFGASLPVTSAAVGDPVWRLPLWDGYKRHLESDVADMNNIWDTPFAGAITAALFLRRFVSNARRFAHFDLYGWRPAGRPLGPKGGEPHTARAVMDHLKRELAS